MTIDSDDQSRMAEIISRGTRAAIAAISQALAGEFPISDPVNASATSLLTSTFYTLAADSRDIFRESLFMILDNPEEAHRLNADELSATLYVALAIDVFSRRPRESVRALSAILKSSQECNDVECLGLALKYMSASRIVTRLDTWKSLYADFGQNNLLVCFTGMAQVSMSESVLWLADVCADEQLEFVASYAMPALVAVEGGVDRVRSCLRRVQGQVGVTFFETLVREYGRAIGVPPGRLDQWQTYLGDGQERVVQGTGDSDYSDRDAVTTTSKLAIKWDAARIDPRPPLLVRQLLQVAA